MAKNRYINKLVGNLRAKESCLRSLRFAITRYLEIRRSWLAGSSPGSRFGWRGGWTNGKLFFFFFTTEKNIELMEEALREIQRQDIEFSDKIGKLERIWQKLSSGGKARELIGTFFSMVDSQGIVYIPKKYCSKGPVVIVNSKEYTKEKKLGKGGGGAAYKFTSEDEQKIVVKDIHKRAKYRYADLDKEASLFQYVYDALGPDFIPDFQPSSEIPSTFFDMRALDREHVMVQPLLPGMTLRKYAFACKSQGATLDETRIFSSCFTFLLKLHELDIAHCDAHIENIMILDDLNSIFIIDYGVAREKRSLVQGDRPWVQYVTYDLAYLFYSVSYLRKITAKAFSRPTPVDMEACVRDFGFHRWVELGMYTDLKQMVRALVNYSNKFPWWNPPRMNQQINAAKMFDMTSPEKAKYCDDESVKRILNS